MKNDLERERQPLIGQWTGHTSVLVYGYPKRYELDYFQGDAVPGYQGTCALTAIANLTMQGNNALTEGQVINRFISNGWGVGVSASSPRPEQTFRVRPQKKTQYC